MKLLFIINHASGKNTTNWKQLMEEHTSVQPHEIMVVMLDETCSLERTKTQIEDFKPHRIIAIGGDGTVKFAASCLLKTSLPLGIIPAGSANGMAKELGIPMDIDQAINIALHGIFKSIHLVQINNELCIHLGDIGFNAFVIKKFETESSRGMWGYIKASWKVLWQQPRMMVELQVDGKKVKRTAAMIVIANATQYGSGALINPHGDLSDELFEVIVVKKISFIEISKMMLTHQAYNPAKTEVYQTQALAIKSRVKAHFQVDGEYLGKVNEVNAKILPSAINVIVPPSPAKK